MVNSGSRTPPHRTQRALSMAAETRKARDAFNFSGGYPYTHQPFHYPPIPIPSPHFDAYDPPASPASPTLSSPSSPSSSSSTSPSPTTPSAISVAYNTAHDTTTSLFGNQDHYVRIVPTITAEQRKEAKIAQRQRREQIILMLQQQQIEAQEKAKQDKLDRQQAKLERKQKRAEFKEMQIRSQVLHEQGPLSVLPDIQYQSSQYYHSEHISSNASTHSSTSTESPRNSSSNPDRMRSLSLKSNTKSMYDLRPWSGSGMPQSPTYDMYSGYESDEASGSHGWDSLMDTLHSPTMTSPSDTMSWDSKEDHDLDLVDSLGSMSLGHDSGNGNGKYLLSKYLFSVDYIAQMTSRFRTVILLRRDNDIIPTLRHHRDRETQSESRRSSLFTPFSLFPPLLHSIRPVSSFGVLSNERKRQETETRLYSWMGDRLSFPRSRNLSGQLKPEYCGLWAVDMWYKWVAQSFFDCFIALASIAVGSCFVMLVSIFSSHRNKANERFC